MAVNENIKAAVTEAVTDAVQGKKWYLSKTFWANIAAGVAISVQMKFGFVVPVEYQTLGLSVINLVLRQITKESIIW